MKTFILSGLISLSLMSFTALNAPKEKVTKTSCTLTVTCSNGSTVSATADTCEKAGKMADAGCS